MVYTLLIIPLVKSAEWERATSVVILLAESIKQIILILSSLYVEIKILVGFDMPR